MKNPKNITIVILAVVLVALAGWTYYTLTVTAPQQATAACTANINNTVIPQVTAQVTAAAQKQCTAAMGQYQQLMTQLEKIPACAAVIPKQ